MIKLYNYYKNNVIHLLQFEYNNKYININYYKLLKLHNKYNSIYVI